ncbi:TetR/AcrR family transcriptional regulator [Pseudomonas sp. Irchel 3E20]|uniref:TetR/AcrR family transcriptional regulator n=1 Tax=Pseudomonas sp. Irchel 3E20 TaxID=2008983 RepID=UPI000BA31E56|nr:TetR family transcriptional regulator [Pseudomonas sp. Irchel 3E20]
MATKGEVRRERVLEAALQVLAQQGAHGFRMRAVASAADLSLSHVQYYFPSLDSLLAAVVERYLREWDQRLAAAPDDLASALTLVLDSHLHCQDCQVLWELWAMAGHDPAANTALTGFYQAYIDRVCVLLARDAAQVPAETIRGRAVLIVALLEGLSVLRGAGREAALAPEAGEQALAAIMALAAMPV